jgi:hypothetical protein
LFEGMILPSWGTDVLRPFNRLGFLIEHGRWRRMYTRGLL